MKEILGFCGAICATGVLLTVLALHDNKECRTVDAAEKAADRAFSLEREDANNRSKERLFAAKTAAEEAARTTANEVAEKAAEAAKVKAAEEAAKLEATAAEAGFSVDEYVTLKSIFETALKKGDLKTATEIGKQLYPYAFQ